jgi:uncharacterized protein (TIGR02117 family)
MKKGIIVLLKTIEHIVDGCLIFVMLYFAASFIFSNIYVNNDFKESEDGIDIYLLSNGVHTDIVVPVKNKYYDWEKEIDYRKTGGQDSTMKYLAIGWGDKGFYLDTPTWADLRLSVAFNAMFWLNTTAMHTTFYKSMTEDDQCRRIRINKGEYLKIIEFVNNKFQRDKNGDIIFISGVPTYGNNDSFYEAKGKYNLFDTCNTWTNRCLKNAGIKACVWTPFSNGLF